MAATAMMRMAGAAALALTAAVSASTVTPSNATDAAAAADGIELYVVASHGEDSAMMPISHVVPQTARAAEGLDPPGLTGQLFYATEQTAQNLNKSNIAFINCDPDAYPGNLQANNVLDTAVDKDAIAVLFFSQSSSYCNVTGVASDYPFVYSMVNATTSQQVLTDLEQTTSSGNQVYFARIQPSADAQTGGNDTMSDGSGGNNGSSSSSNQNNPLGPSPSTAVAMIILYSITGVITALFLVIIITGALRAHRHPERYGPGVVLAGGNRGQRQTRVRGIARAMLDTIPIVKFGEQTNRNQDPKPTDLEMGENTGRNSAEADQQQRRSAEGNGEAGAPAMTGAAATSAAAVSGSNNSSSSRRNSQDAGSEAPRAAAPDTAGTANGASDVEAGINPAAAGSSAENLASDSDVYTGCTICTDEFEPGQDVRVLPCDHKFHPACIDPWLLNVSGTCPLCRIDLHPVTSNDTTGADPSSTRRSASILAPPLSPTDPDAINASSASPSSGNHQRRSVLRDLFHLRSPEERVAAARRLRDSHGADQMDGAPAEGRLTVDEQQPAEHRRRSRLSGLFHHHHHGRRSRVVERPSTAEELADGSSGNSNLPAAPAPAVLAPPQGGAGEASSPR